MKIKLTLTTAFILSGLLAAPAFAQSSATKAEDYAKENAVEEVKDKAKDMASDNMKKDMTDSDPAMMIKGDPLTIETPTAIITAEDAEMTMEDGSTILEADEVTTKSKMIDTAAPAATTTVTVSCPKGTTAQDDGTCMITGDYKE